MKPATIPLLYWFAFLGILLWMTGCRAPKPVTVKETFTETFTETIHDTVFQTEKDTSHYRALLDCQNGRVVIKEVKEAKAGKYLTAPKVNLEGNNLNVDCHAEAQKLFAQWKSQRTKREVIKEIPVFIEMPLTLWQKIQLWSGRVLILLLALLAVAFIIKRIIKKYG